MIDFDDTISLTEMEMFMAASAGVMRYIKVISRGYQNTHGEENPGGWERHVEGALAELALGKYLNLHWSGVGSIENADVGSIEVRVTRHRTGRLIVHDNDRDEAPFYLLVGERGTYRVVGWIKGSAAKDQIYWCDPTGKRPAYFVPQEDLTPPHVLPSEVPRAVSMEWKTLP